MHDHIHHLVQKYLHDKCSVEEAEIVFDYLDTNEGLKVLSTLLGEDIEQIEKITFLHNHLNCDYDRLLFDLQKIIENKS